jgi:transglutaminase-like putative cysteine protease
VLEGRSFLIEHDGPTDSSRTLLVFSTLPMRGARWTPMARGEMRVARRGSCVWSSHPASIEEHHFRLLGSPHPEVAQTQLTAHGTATQQQHSFAPALQREVEIAPDRATLSIVHSTVFRYTLPVERSSHRFCLHPVRDERQEILAHALELSVDGIDREFEDVFGNRAMQLEVTTPFDEMSITSRSTVRVEGVLASQLKSPLRRDEIPLVWMPWQRQMMQAYLMPPELPEPELRELSEFGMSFVERNDYDLVETLLDLNRTIYRDFTYVSGSTTVETTPFEAYASRKGVCQDFANVLICVARLLGVPARYRVGYIYTGGSYENKIQSDASHAWAEVYLPWTGWFGFDPTNGCLAGADHVRVACGRQFRDAAPTSGTIYRGGGTETLSVEVRVERLDDEVDGPTGL